jgi:hypothetical protein
MLSTERDLLNFGEVVDGIAVEDKGPNVLDGNKILGNELGRIKQIEIELCNLS